MVYSAATPATDRKASFTRASKPGLSGAKGVSMSLDMPAACAARKMRFRRIRNCDAANGSPKSETSIAQALSYAAHSGDSASGVSFRSGAFLGISFAFSGVGSSQGYNPQPIISQNINEDVKPTVQKPARDESFFDIVLAVVKEHLHTGPVEAGRIGKMQATLRKVVDGFGLVPFKLKGHSLSSRTISCGVFYHERKSLSKLYIPVRGLWISNILRQFKLRAPNAGSARMSFNPKCGQLTGTEGANA